jgi:hypothetical protein
LLEVDVIAALHRAYRALARILVLQAAQHVVEQPFAQRAGADLQTLDFQRAQDLGENRHTARENGCALRSQAGQVQMLHMLRLDHLIDDRLDGPRTDPAVGQLQVLSHVGCRARRAGGTERTLPAAAAEGCGDGAQLQACGESRALEPLGTQLAVSEVRAAHADASDVQALEMLGLIAFADDELGAAAADIDDEIRSVRRIGVVRDTEIDQSRLLDAGNDLHGMPERLFGFGEEGVGVAGSTQRVGADDSNLVGAHVAQPLRESP